MNMLHTFWRTSAIKFTVQWMYTVVRASRFVVSCTPYARIFRINILNACRLPNVCVCVCVSLFSFAFISFSHSVGLNSHLWIFDTMWMGHLSHFIWFPFSSFFHHHHPHVYCVKLNFRSKNSDIFIAVDIRYCYLLYELRLWNAILIYHRIQFTFLMQTNWNLVSNSGIILKRNHQIAIHTLLLL